MSATVPRTGLRLHLRRATRVAWATLAAALLILPTSAASADTTEDPASEGEVTLQLTPAAGGVITSGATARVNLTIVNDTGFTLSEADANVEIGSRALDDATALAAWLGAGDAPGAFLTAVSAPTASVPAGESLEIELLADPTSLEDPSPGVYPLRAVVSDATTGSVPDLQHHVLEARSVLIVSEEERQIALLVPVTLTPNNDGALLTAEELEIATGPEGVLTAHLEALRGTSAVIAIDPSIPAAIRALGHAAPESAVTWWRRLEALSNERFALQFGDADVTVQAQAQLGEPLAAPSLSAYLNPLNFLDLDDDASPPPAEDAAEAAELPTMEELTGIRSALPDLLWPRGSVREDDLDTFAGYFGAETTTILPSSAATPAGTGRAESGENALLLYDSAASAALSHALAEPDAVLRAALLTEAAADIALSPDTGPLLLALERDEERTLEALEDLWGVLAPLGTSLRLDDLQQQDAASVSIGTVGEQARAALLPELLADEEEIVAFSSILENPGVLTERERIRLLRLIGVGEPAEGFTAAADAHRERTQTILGSVGIQSTSDMQILSAAVDLPVWVYNELPWPATVTLGARSMDPRLDVEAETVVELLPLNNTRVRVPVQARIASGEVDVQLNLTSATGVRIGSPNTTHVIVRAEWESIGLVVLGVLVALLLTFGVIRTIRRRRKTDAASEPAEQGAEIE